MCGITGQVNLHRPVDQRRFSEMNDTLEHRGPDGKGIFVSSNHKIALGHRRLSFLDLSSAGKQPMASHAGNVIITFNGEVYNFRELRQQLDYPFETQTDTEVVIAAYLQWGTDCVSYLKGMFAFAILDEDKNKLFMARDRFGIKPLYYTQQQDSLIFASELKAIMHSGIVKKEIDLSSFTDFFVYRYIPSPKTIWKNVWKLPPAHFAEIDLETLAMTQTEYWKIESSENSPEEDDMARQVDELLTESVRSHAFADVPVGSFLSGGYDSSAIVSYLTESGIVPDTFSIGFSHWENSEDRFAEMVARHLGVPNSKVVADESNLQLLEKMPDVYDEPIADISIVPTYLVSELARQKVKAVLSGEGADEIFGGYHWQKEFFALNHPSGLIQKLKMFFKPIDTVSFYANAMAMGWFDRAELQKMLHPDLHQHIAEDVHWFYRQHFDRELTPLKSIQKMDMKCFMGELVLTKIDRASMANSLEVRVPFLDHELFEKIFAVNEKTYFKPGKTKYMLLENIKDKLPPEIIARKKQGFVGPDSYYMNIEWYRNQLKNSKLVELKMVNPEYIDHLLEETYNWKLWKLVVMEKWLQKWM